MTRILTTNLETGISRLAASRRCLRLDSTHGRRDSNPVEYGSSDDFDDFEEDDFDDDFDDDFEEDWEDEYDDDDDDEFDDSEDD